MNFGLNDALESFQIALDIFLTAYEWHTFLVYLDENIIFSNYMEYNFHNTGDILSALDTANIKIKLDKF